MSTKIFISEEQEGKILYKEVCDNCGEESCCCCENCGDYPCCCEENQE